MILKKFTNKLLIKMYINIMTEFNPATMNPASINPAAMNPASINPAIILQENMTNNIGYYDYIIIFILIIACILIYFRNKL